jgi:anti-anti-sigma factor
MGPCSDEQGRSAWWPAPDPIELADRSLGVCATAPRAGLVIVRAIGEIDLLTAPAWRRTLNAAVRIAASTSPTGPFRPTAAVAAGRRTPRLVCDLTPATFFGTTGVSVLVDLAALAAEYGVELCVVAARHGRVDQLLHISGLDRRVAVHSQVEHAVASAG